jgi:hypothetical protein
MTSNDQIPLSQQSQAMLSRLQAVVDPNAGDIPD